MWVHMSSRHKNLIIVRAGPGSLHANWLKGGGPVFDVLVAAYHPDAMAKDTERIRHKFLPGAKVAGWNAVLNDHPELLDQYDRIAFIDDDVDATTSTINKCFKVGERYALQIWQPALSADSYITYAASLQNPRFELRFCNYVEMMCPFFHTKLLKKVAPLFAMGFEFGHRSDLVQHRQREWRPMRRGRRMHRAAHQTGRPGEGSQRLRQSQIRNRHLRLPGAVRHALAVVGRHRSDFP